MKKKIFDRLKKSNVYKIALALSLAFALLLSGVPIDVKADELLPSYASIVEDSVDWVQLYINGGENCASTGHYLLVWMEHGASGFASRMVQSRLSMGDNGYYLEVVYLNYKNSSGTSIGDVVAPRVYFLNEYGVWEYLENTNFGTSDRSLDVKSASHEHGNVSLTFYSASYGLECYTKRGSGEYVLKYTGEGLAVTSYGNSSVDAWNGFLSDTKDFIGYHYVTENGRTLWKELRFNHDVYPYWAQDADGTRKLMIYAPYEQTVYMTKDVGRYVEDGIYDYYVSTIEFTDEWCIQPYAWYTDYQPDTSAPDKVFEVVALPYTKDGWGADANAERTLIEVYDSKLDAISAYRADNGIVDTPEVTPTIPPEPSPDPLPPTDDSESMGFVDFIKQFENLFNASGNLWKIMYYCFAFLPQQILWCIQSAVHIFLAVMVIKWVRE